MTDVAPGSAIRRLEETLLGGTRRWNRLQVAEQTGMSTERGAELWRAMGFAEVDDHEVMFTDADVAALRSLHELEDSGLVDPHTAVAQARAMGQQLARLADWQVALVSERMAAQIGEVSTERQVELTRVVAEHILPAIEQLVVFVWRRQLAAIALRPFGEQEAAVGDNRTLTVGFVDLVGYTELTRDMDDQALSGLLEAFEARATDLVVRHGARMVKTLGDEVLFVADTAEAAGEVALALAELHEADDDLPRVRGGLACGDVLTRFGDVFGATVNLASRLTTRARPGTVLVDAAAAEQLGSTGQFALRRVPRQHVRGFPPVEAYALRRPEGTPQAPDALAVSSDEEET